MRIKLSVVIIGGILFASGVCSGQPKVITSQVYFDSYSVAIGQVLGQPRVRKENRETYKNGRLINIDEELEEVESPSARREVYLERVGAKTTKRESREVDGVFYCKTNSAPWRRSNTECLTRGVMMTSGPEDLVTEYSVEQVSFEDKKAWILRHYSILQQSSEEKKKNLKPRFTENRVWIDERTRIVRREYKTVDVEGKDYTTILETYVYDQKIKIEAPLTARIPAAKSSR